MPVTRGSGNPLWTWDETLLALDLLYRHGRPIDKGHQDILDLSGLLRNASFYPLDQRKDNFRNPDGVAFKLQNLFSVTHRERKIEFSHTDEAVVLAFPASRSGELSVLASLIREALRDPKSASLSVADTDEVFIEGAVLSARHRSRDKRLRMRLLASMGGEELSCTVCGLHCPDLPRDLQESLFEAHHIVPLSQAEGLRKTKLQDAALICACCHRFVHRLISMEKRWVPMDEAARLRMSRAMDLAG